MKIHLPLGFIFLILFAASCGGGGGGGSSAGQQAVLTTFNASSGGLAVDTSVDGDLISTSVMPGQSAAFESVLTGDRMVKISEVGSERSFELQNNFELGIPYTIIVVDSNKQLTPLLAANDRSDTPAGEFRIRAINASSRAGTVSVRIVPGIVGRLSRLEVSSTPQPIATAVAALTPAQPLVTPTVEATATAVITPTVVVPGNSSEIVAENLEFKAVGEYIFAPKGDYRIVVEAQGQSVKDSAVISYAGGQVISVVIRDATSSEGGGVVLSRLNDRP